MRRNSGWPDGHASPALPSGHPPTHISWKRTIVLPDLRINPPRLEPDPVLLEQLSQLSSASAPRGATGPHIAFPDVGGHRPGRRRALLAHRHPARRRLAVRPPADAPADPSAGSARRRPASSPDRRTWSRPGRPSYRRDRRSRTRTTATTPARPSRTRTTATTPARPSPTRTTATTPARPSPTRTTATTPARPSPTRTTATTPARPSPTTTAATRTPVRRAGRGQGGGQANGHRS